MAGEREVLKVIVKHRTPDGRLLDRASVTEKEAMAVRLVWAAAALERPGFDVVVERASSLLCGGASP